MRIRRFLPGHSLALGHTIIGTLITWLPHARRRLHRGRRPLIPRRSWMPSIWELSWASGRGSRSLYSGAGSSGMDPTIVQMGPDCVTSRYNNCTCVYHFGRCLRSGRVTSWYNNCTLCNHSRRCARSGCSQTHICPKLLFCRFHTRVNDSRGTNR